MVVKGFPKYRLLELLGEKPMSGTETTNEIERRANGRWKPSPGSIYPLLAWLKDNDHVKVAIFSRLETPKKGLMSSQRAYREADQSVNSN